MVRPIFAPHDDRLLLNPYLKGDHLRFSADIRSLPGTATQLHSAAVSHLKQKYLHFEHHGIGEAPGEPALTSGSPVSINTTKFFIASSRNVDIRVWFS